MNPQQHGDRTPIPNRVRVPANTSQSVTGTPRARKEL